MEVTTQQETTEVGYDSRTVYRSTAEIPTPDERKTGKNGNSKFQYHEKAPVFLIFNRKIQKTEGDMV